MERTSMVATPWPLAWPRPTGASRRRGPAVGRGPFAGLRSRLRDLNAAAAAAGVTTALWYVVGMVPVQVAVMGQLGVGAAQASSWLFVVWLTGALSSVLLALRYRQPLSINSNTAALLYLAALGGRFTYPELMGASLLAGVVIVAAGVLGVGGRLLQWLPLPLAMAMLAGSLLGDVRALVTATAGDQLVAGATVGGYLVARGVRGLRLPPIGLGALGGALAIVLTQRATPGALVWGLPTPTIPPMAFSVQAFAAVSLPLVVLSLGLGNLQGLGFLVAQGYRVPTRPVSAVVGATTMVNALFGGHATTVSRVGVAILAGPEAGPPGGRYWAVLIAGALMGLVALGARPAAALLDMVPASYVAILAGLGLLAPFQEALEVAFRGPLRFGAVLAFAVAATPLSLAGVPSSFWALLAGVLGAAVAERAELVAHWRAAGSQDGAAGAAG
jgi:benzoate membrane transport protein